MACEFKGYGDVNIDDWLLIARYAMAVGSNEVLSIKPELREYFKEFDEETYRYFLLFKNIYEIYSLKERGIAHAELWATEEHLTQVCREFELTLDEVYRAFKKFGFSDKYQSFLYGQIDPKAQ